MKKSIYLFLITLLVPFLVRASHAMGGEINYTWISGNTYSVSYNFYRDCMGISAPTMETINCSSSCYTPLTFTLLPDSNAPHQIANVCSGFSTTCNGGTLNGIERWVYTGIVTLPGSCSDWKFSVTECCRNTSITNLSPGLAAYFSAMLNNDTAQFNSSVQFSSDPIPYLYVGTLNTVNVGAFDPDNDSLVISLVNAMSGNNQACTYSTPFSGASPVSSSTPITVDAHTGNISFTPTQPEVDVIVIQVDEYRNGILVGSSTRDFQFTIINSPNHLPYLFNGPAPSSFVRTACAGDTLNFLISSADIDATDSTSITISADDLGSVASLFHFGGQRDSVMVQIITDGTLTSPVAHRLNVTVKDNHCPYFGSQSYTYLVYVNGCSADVWPGDANNDLSCNLYDILPIGLGFNATGSTRANASLNWVAQPSADWTSSFISGVNYKFTDCDGNGTIDYTDTVAIAQNYNFTHPVRLSNPTNNINTVGNMYLISSTDTSGPSGQLSVRVNLGDATNPATRIYGIAFRLSFNPNIIDAATSAFRFSNSQLGDPSNGLLTFTRTDWVNGYIDAVAVRTDHTDQNIDSTIAVFDVVIVDNVSARTVLQFNLEGVRAIDASGMAKYFSIINDSVSVASGTTGIKAPIANEVSTYPNPANRYLKISGVANMSRIIIRDLNGKAVLSTTAVWSEAAISTEQLAEGIYMAEIYSGNTVIRKRFNVVH